MISAIESALRPDGIANGVVVDSHYDSGLANQLRGLTSTMLLAEHWGRDLYVNWGDNQDVGAITRLADILDAPIFKSTEVTRSKLSRLQMWFCYYERRGLLALRHRIPRKLATVHQFNHLGCDMIATALSRRCTPVISSYYSFFPDRISHLEFYRRRHSIYSRFVLEEASRRKIDEFTGAEFTGPMIGVHLRTGISVRNRETMQMDANPYWFGRGVRFDLFYDMLDREIEHFPETRIFLATDNTHEAQPLTQRYADRICSAPKKTTDGMVDRFSLEDQRGALVDLYLLSRCGKIIGTYNSTFSYEAAVWGDRPFVEVCLSGMRQQYEIAPGKSLLIDFRDNRGPSESCLADGGVQCGSGDFWKDHFHRSPTETSLLPLKESVPGHAAMLLILETLSRVRRPVIVDVGARTGACSLLTRFLHGSVAYAFETNPDEQELLRSNIALNTLEDRVFVKEARFLDEPDRWAREWAKVDLLRIGKGAFEAMSGPSRPGNCAKRETAALNSEALRAFLTKFVPAVLIEDGVETDRARRAWYEPLRATLESLGYQARMMDGFSLHLDR